MFLETVAYFTCVVLVYFRSETRTLVLPFIKTPDQLEPVEQLVMNLLQHNTWNNTVYDRPVIHTVSCSNVSPEECFETALFMAGEHQLKLQTGL